MQYDMWICEPLWVLGWTGAPTTETGFPKTVELELSDFFTQKHEILLTARQVRPLVLAKNVGFGGTGFASEYEQTAGTDGDDCYRERHLTMSLYGSDSAYRNKTLIRSFQNDRNRDNIICLQIHDANTFFCAKVTLYKPIWLMSAWIVCIRISHPLLNEAHNDGSIGLGTRNFYHFRPRSGSIGVPCSSFPSQRRTPSVSQLANGPLLHICGLLYLI